jgi:partitioning defective protein 3
LESELELRIVRTMKKSSFFLNRSNSTELQQNTKRLGKLVKITLVKGQDGLGFKLASRDNPTGIANPIYVKTIFGKGAAIDDGRLKAGDRLLMVNSIDVTQMSLQDTVGLLRETRIGETINLCISRQQDGSLPKDLVRDSLSRYIFVVCSIDGCH